MDQHVTPIATPHQGSSSGLLDLTTTERMLLRGDVLHRLEAARARRRRTVALGWEVLRAPPGLPAG